jgi:tetratricopeptide (TPR) repeat protein
MTCARAMSLQMSILAVLMAVVVSGCGGAHSRYMSHLERGKQYLAQENLDKAGIEFRNALQIEPKNADALYFNGRVAELRRNVREAVGLYQAAIDSRPDFELARASLGKVLVLVGATQRALEAVEPGLTRHPDNSDLLAVRAVVRHQMKDDVAARADAEHAVQVAPTNENAIAALAALYNDSGERERAVCLVSGAVQQAPSSTDLRGILANLYLAAGQPQKAEEQMRAVIKLKPRELGIRVQLAMHFARAHNLDAAQKVLEEAVRDYVQGKDQSHADAARLALVDFISAQRSRADGEKLLRGFIAAQPGNADLRFGLGTLLQRTGALDDAIATYREVIERESTGAQGLIARDRIAAIQLSQGHVDEANKLIDEVLRKNPRDDDALLMRANVELRRKDPTSAIADLRIVARDQPHSVLTHRTLARAYLDKGQPGLAEEAYRAAMQAAPGDMDVQLEFAQFLTQTDRAPQAATLLEGAISRLPESAAAREGLVRAYLAKHDLPAARVAADALKVHRPDAAAGFYLSGSIAAQQQRLADSQADLERALALQPASLDILTLLSRVEVARGAAAGAISRVEAAIAGEPRNAALPNLLGELYLQQKDTSHAGEAFGHASKLDPRAWLPHRNLAVTRLAANDPAAAVAEYEKALELAPVEPRLVVELTALYEKQGRVDDAIARYDALYKKSSSSVQQLAANNLAMLLVTYKTDKGSLDRARDLTSSFATSNDSSLLDTSGWVRFKRREYQDAVAALQRAAERAPDSKVIRYHLGMTELQLGHRDQALSNLESALTGPGTFTGADEARVALADLRGRSG